MRRSLSLSALLALATGCPFVPTLDDAEAPALARGAYALVVTDLRAAPGCSALGIDGALTGLTLGAQLSDTAHGDLVLFIEGLPLVASQAGADFRAQGFVSLDAFGVPVPEPLPPVTTQDDSGETEPGAPGDSDAPESSAGGGAGARAGCVAFPNDGDRDPDAEGEGLQECPPAPDPAPTFPSGVHATLTAEVLAEDAFDGSLRASIYAPEAGVDCLLVLAIDGVHLDGDDAVQPLPTPPDDGGGSRPGQPEEITVQDE
jgi:hypothetical protein